ncbi:MAG: histidine kinase dimerization/phosphoacceptor domain -containing protein [Desulforhopalus sp.]
MAAPWKNRIGIKLFGIMALVIVLAVLPIAVVVLISVNTFGQYSATINEDQITLQAESFLSRLVREQGHRYEEYFNRAGMAAMLMSTSAREVYNHLNSFAQMQKTPVKLLWQPENGMYVTPRESPIVTVYWGKETLGPEILKEIQAVQALDSILKKTKELLPESLATHMITTSGIGLYHTWSDTGKEVVRHLPRATAFDLRDGAPMTLFTGENHPYDSAGWTGIYRDDVLDGLMITVCGPIIDRDGVFRGVTGIDLPLQTIIENVLLHAGSENREGTQVLFAFLMDSQGKLIAFPPDYMDYFGVEVDFSGFRNSGDLLRYNLKDSREEGVRRFVANLADADSSIQQVVVQGENHILASHVLPTLGWQFVLVTKEGDIISSVQRTQNALRGTLQDLKREFLLNTIIIAGIALVLVFMAIRYFVSPLQKIADTAKRVGEGDLGVRCDLHRNDELGTLAETMNEMIVTLAEADEMKSSYSKKLENDINTRTSDLEHKNQQLNTLIGDLQAESRKRRKITIALREIEKQQRSIMESSLAGLCILQNGRFKYVNSAILEMFGYSQKQMLDDLRPADIILPEFWDSVHNRLLRREAGEMLDNSSAYHIRCRSREGFLVDVLVKGATTTWKGLPAIVGTIVDISQLKQVEKRLRENEKRLQGLVEEKDVLLREVYHRTKNNMLVIISMLNLQMDGIEDHNARRVFAETENRIRAMALVHENLCSSGNLTEINLGQYLESLVKILVDTMTMDNRIEVRAQCVPVTISFDQAIPLGLVVNELVTNSVKYAFPEGEAGEIRLILGRQEQEITLVVADNGIGLPPDIDVDNINSFGLQITANMITRQLQGTYTVERENGTAYIVRFPETI